MQELTIQEVDVFSSRELKKVESTPANQTSTIQRKVQTVCMLDRNLGDRIRIPNRTRKKGALKRPEPLCLLLLMLEVSQRSSIKTIIAIMS